MITLRELALADSMDVAQGINGIRFRNSSGSDRWQGVKEKVKKIGHDSC